MGILKPDVTRFRNTISYNHAPSVVLDIGKETCIEEKRGGNNLYF